MTLEQKRVVIIVLSLLFLASLLFVQRMEVVRRAEEAGLTRHVAAVPAASKSCVDCHRTGNSSDYVFTRRSKLVFEGTPTLR